MNAWCKSTTTKRKVWKFQSWDNSNTIRVKRNHRLWQQRQSSSKKCQTHVISVSNFYHFISWAKTECYMWHNINKVSFLSFQACLWSKVWCGNTVKCRTIAWSASFFHSVRISRLWWTSKLSLLKLFYDIHEEKDDEGNDDEERRSKKQQQFSHASTYAITFDILLTFCKILTHSHISYDTCSGCGE